MNINRVIARLLWISLAICPQSQAQTSPVRLSIEGTDARGWIRVVGANAAHYQVMTLDGSSDLELWEPLAVLHGNSFVFSDPATPGFPTRYYRATSTPYSPTNDWRNQAFLPYDPLSHFSGGPLDWLKFAILTADPTRVYYGDSDSYVFHYDFARARLGPFLQMDPAQFESISQFNTNRQVVLGTLLLPTHLGAAEYGIQLVSQDALPLGLVRDLFRLVESTVIGERPLQALYIPTFEQAAVAQINADYFASNGIPVSSAARWSGGDIPYAEGWALGILKFFPASEVPLAYAEGRLTPDDILLTDGVPAELPYLSGILTLTPTTPNSHVAMLAQSYGVPFAYLAGEPDRARVLQLTNREVAFQTCGLNGAAGCKVLVVEVDPPLEPEVKSGLLALKTPPAVQVIPKERFGAYTATTDNLSPADLRYFGGKAANYGVLRRAIPSNVEPAIAISFDLWDDFMDQPWVGGGTLRDEIASRLDGLTYPPDFAAVSAQLESIRNLIRNGAGFTPAQIQPIIAALTILDPARKIRFRSSTNVEDAESFSGAGLYDSYSGCLADDLDGDDDGPSSCDPTEENERGVFRAIRRVYASFYNENAYLERLRLGIDEAAVGMAMLVHHSTPDETEQANGVATGTWRRDAPIFFGTLATQLGAVSVANPDGSAIPEEVQFTGSLNEAPYLRLLQGSSLARLGENVMTWTGDYASLTELLFQSAQAYGAWFPGKPELQLDLEFKKVDPGVLEVKQIRQIPAPSVHYVPPVVLNQPVTLLSWQGYYDNLWMAHRLKSRWTLSHRSIPFSATELSNGFYTDITIEYLDGTNVQTLSGPVSSFPNATHSASPTVGEVGFSMDRWTLGTLAGPAEFLLSTFVSGEVSSRTPFAVLAPRKWDRNLRLDVTFPSPLPNISALGTTSHRTNAMSFLYPRRIETEDDWLVETTYQIPGQGTNITIHTAYWLPFEAEGDDCRCPILRFVETRIEGFTSEPIVLRGYWSQTFEDVHYHQREHFLFEPRLESGLPAAQIQELAAADLTQIYLNENGAAPQVLMLVGFDGAIRRFSDQDLVIVDD